jgi:putative two-component system response regulator
MAVEPKSPLPPTADPAQAQLLAYARDFRKLADADRDKALRLEGINRQLQVYARDLKTAFNNECRRTRELERAYHDTVRRLVAASRYKDEETGRHTERVALYARELAQHIGWHSAAAQLLEEAAPMHDVGKLGVPDAILLKPAPLAPDEVRVMRKHTVLGAALLKGSASPLLELARQIALSHHEHWDGTGYPHGLAGENIPRAARLVMLGDQYDALRSTRPYKPAFTHGRAVDILLNGDGRTLPQHFDPELLDAFRYLQGKYRQIYDTRCD